MTMVRKEVQAENDRLISQATAESEHTNKKINKLLEANAADVLEFSKKSEVMRRHQQTLNDEIAAVKRDKYKLTLNQSKTGDSTV